MSENKDFLEGLEGESFGDFDLGEPNLSETDVISNVEDSEELYELTTDTVVKEVKQETKRKVKKASKLTSKYFIIPTVIIVISLTYFTVKVGSFTNLIEQFYNFITGGGKAISADTEDYGVDARLGTDKKSVEQGEIKLTVNKEEQERLDDLSANSRVSIVISSSPYFSTVSEKGALYISNPPDSQYSEQVVIITKDTEEEMYVSPILDPNEKVEEDYLTNQSFKPGRYEANALFNYYSKSINTESGKEEYSYIGTMVAEIFVVIDE